MSYLHWKFSRRKRIVTSWDNNLQDLPESNSLSSNKPLANFENLESVCILKVFVFSVTVQAQKTYIAIDIANKTAPPPQMPIVESSSYHLSVRVLASFLFIIVASASDIKNAS